MRIECYSAENSAHSIPQSSIRRPLETQRPPPQGDWSPEGPRDQPAPRPIGSVPGVGGSAPRAYGRPLMGQSRQSAVGRRAVQTCSLRRFVFSNPTEFFPPSQHPMCVVWPATKTIVQCRISVQRVKGCPNRRPGWPLGRVEPVLISRRRLVTRRLRTVRNDPRPLSRPSAKCRPCCSCSSPAPCWRRCRPQTDATGSEGASLCKSHANFLVFYFFLKKFGKKYF